MTYFTPDRSDRPESTNDLRGKTTEVGTDQTKTKALADGRTAVVESAGVDGFHMVYYYFDAKGLEDATDEELRDLLTDSGINVPAPSSIDDDPWISLSAHQTTDAQDRCIWQFQITMG